MHAPSFTKKIYNSHEKPPAASKRQGAFVIDYLRRRDQTIIILARPVRRYS